ncbi:MAG: SurA N-terminal domain-containing protein [Candidatus Dojkabacteria bacterium]|nr:SurA N-terminal domain-containing protein [Candidatus Dojkabacteria bacterium]
MPKKVVKKSTAPKKKAKKVQIKFKKPTWEGIKESKITKYSLLVLLILLFFVVIDLGVQYLNNDYSAAVVNGQRISEKDYYYRLDQAYGSAIVSQLIDEKLISQKAQELNVEATQEEIDEEIADITEQVGGEEQLNMSLEAYNLTLEDLRRQIETDIVTRKMIEPTLEYTEDDVLAFFEKYSAMMFPEEAAELEEGELLDYESHKDDALKIFLQQEIESEKGKWIEDMREEARIQNNVTDSPKYKLLGATRNIISNILDQMNSNDPAVETEPKE